MPRHSHLPSDTSSPPPSVPVAERPVAGWAVHIMPSQRGFEAAPGETLLAAAERAGIALPSSCRNGTCRTCLCKMRAGTVHYQVQWPGLSVEEKADNYILPCVALATSDVVLEQPEAADIGAR